MYLDAESLLQLTYCTNIHPGNGWDEVFGNLQEYTLALKERLVPDQPFGIGLRLSGIESSQLLASDNLQHFKDFLDEHGLYVFTLNGFPYGPFHKQAVKAEVHRPDWREEERVRYTLRLIEILAALLPRGAEGSISTSPLSYKSWVDSSDETTWMLFTQHFVQIAEVLVQIYQQQGKLIHLDIEPEPDGLLENSEEVARFYTDWLLQDGAERLAQVLQVSRDQAKSYILEHICICFDTCHVAVAYEKPADVLERFDEIGIKVGKVQISSALKILFLQNGVTRKQTAADLVPFSESTYLHQVVQQNQDGSFRQYADLIAALPFIEEQQIAEWRIHFHVPIFIGSYASFQSTQDTIVNTLDLLAKRPFCNHLEIETYTWSVLPEDMKQNLLDMITREYQWVLKTMHNE